MQRVIGLFLGIVFLSCGAAYSSSADDARALFEQGDYDAAISMAIDLKTAEGLTLAAESMSAKVMLGYVEDANDSAKTARKWAEKAVKKAPNSQEAQVQYALAYGFETRTSSPFRAWRKKLPEKTLKTIEAYRAEYPDDPRGDALLGAWHLGIVRKTGKDDGKGWYGASEEDGIKYYQSAMDAAPDNIVIASNFGVTLLSVDMDAHFDKATELLTTVSGMQPRNAVDVDVQKRVVRLLEASQDRGALKDAVDELLDGNLPEG